MDQAEAVEEITAIRDRAAEIYRRLDYLKPEPETALAIARLEEAELDRAGA